MQSIKALAFDTGGTVLDWHSGLVAALTETGRRHGVERDWARIANDYRRRSLQGMTGAVSPRFNIDDVHRDVLETIVAENGLACFSAEERRMVVRRWHELDAWPDFAPALDRLRQRYVVVSFTILSLSLVIDVSRRGTAWHGTGCSPARCSTSTSPCLRPTAAPPGCCSCGPKRY